MNFSKLPSDILYKIVSFNEGFKLRNGKISSLIDKNDIRYSLLENICIRNNRRNSFGVFLGERFFLNVFEDFYYLIKFNEVKFKEKHYILKKYRKYYRYHQYYDSQLNENENL
jgi:hypothetical protein